MNITLIHLVETDRALLVIVDDFIPSDGVGQLGNEIKVRLGDAAGRDRAQKRRVPRPAAGCHR